MLIRFIAWSVVITVPVAFAAGIVAAAVLLWREILT
jgi:hypothetical protein